jgi:hypothetical protein
VANSDIFLRVGRTNPADITLYPAGFIAGAVVAATVFGLVGQNFNIIRQAWETPAQVTQFVPTAENLPPPPVVAENPAFTPYPFGIIGQWVVDWPAQGFQKNVLPVTPGDQPPRLGTRPLDALAWQAPDPPAQGFAKTAAWNIPPVVATSQPYVGYPFSIIASWQSETVGAQGFQRGIPATQGDRPPGRAPSYLQQAQVWPGDYPPQGFQTKAAWNLVPPVVSTYQPYTATWFSQVYAGWQQDWYGSQSAPPSAAWNVPVPIPPPPVPDITPYSNSSGGGAASPGSRPRHEAGKRDNGHRNLGDLIGKRALRLDRARKDEMELMAILTILIEQDLL